MVVHTHSAETTLQSYSHLLSNAEVPYLQLKKLSVFYIHLTKSY